MAEPHSSQMTNRWTCPSLAESVQGRLQYCVARCEVWGSHSGLAEYSSLLGCCDVSKGSSDSDYLNLKMKPLRSFETSSSCPSPHLRSILIVSSHLRLFSKWLRSVRFPQQNSARTFPFPLRARGTTHLIHVYLITGITTLGEDYRAWSSSPLCSLLQSPVTSSLLGPKYIQRS